MKEMENMENVKYIKVPCWCVAWQQKMNAPTSMSVILMTIKGIYENKDKLNIVESDNEEMILTTKYISNNIYNCIDGKLIRNALLWLKDKDVIEYRTDNKFLYIKIQFDKLAKKEQEYNDGDYKDKFFIVYYYAVKVGMDLSAKALFIPIMLSKYIYEKSKKTFESNMSVSYVKNKFYNLFTKAQEKRANKLLIDAGYMEEETLVYETDCGFCKPRYFTIKMDKIEKEINKFYRPYLAKEKVVVVKSAHNITSYATKDKLKSGSYTKEEKEAFRRKAEELEAAGEQMIF